MSPTESQKIADMLFPDVSAHAAAEFLAASAPRELPSDACVTRFSPSPTGFLHIGGIYAALVSQRIAHQSSGVFMLRIEDTDKQREIANGVALITHGLDAFGIQIDEGVLPNMEQVGAYGPYIQSERLPLYRAFIKELVAAGNAYPCFCTPAELEEARATQELQKIKTGYYGTWARHREISADEVAARIARGEQYAVRVKSRGANGEKFAFTDLVKGDLTLGANDQDSVLYKSDGYPTYHWAHIVDDKLMRTTHVIRGDEWLSSVPLHTELFALMGWAAPHYAHIAPIVKIDETGSKRKLSKRKDPEANVDFYFRAGYPVRAVTEYLLNLANSNFEDWRREHPRVPNSEFDLRLEKIQVSGALFDFVKLADVSKQIIAEMSATEIFEAVSAWATDYDAPLAEWLSANAQYALAIFGIERSGDKRRKDLTKWEDVRNSISYFMDDAWEIIWPEKIDRAVAGRILTRAMQLVDVTDSAEVWLTKLRGIATELGFAPDTKSYKAAPENFKGHVGDVAGVLRVALTGRTNTPDLHELMCVLGGARVHARFTRAITTLHD